MDLWQTVHDHFTSPKSAKDNQTRVSSGLRTWEQTILKTYHTIPGLVLNIGCGTGREALALHQQNYSVVGLDIALPELKIARKTLPSDISLFCTDGLRLPFNDCSFEHIAMWSQTFGNVPFESNRKFLLSECHRLLKPGGTLSFSVHNLETCEPVAKSKGWILQAHDPYPGDFLLQGDTPVDAPCYWHYFSQPEILDLCAQCGFTPEICELDSHFGQNWNNLWICVATKEFHSA